MRRSRLSPVPLAAAVALALAGCGGSTAPLASTPTPQAPPSAGDPSRAPSASAQEPGATQLPAGALVGESRDARLREATTIGFMGDELVAEIGDALLVLDPASGRVIDEVAFPDLPRINGTLLTGDSLWLLDHDHGKVVRVDRESGEVEAEVEIGGRAVSLLATPDGIWAGSAHILPESVSLIDTDTNEIVRRLELGAFPVYDDGYLWFGRNETGWASTVRKVDPDTGEIVASIDLDGAEGCYLGGRFPDVVWSWCFEPPPNDTDVTRLDVDALAVAAIQPLGAGGGLLGVYEDTSWLGAEPADGSRRLLKVDNATNAVEAVYSSDHVMPITIHDGALWMIDTDAGALRRIDLADL